MRAFRIQVQWEQAARILLFLMSHCLSANRCTLLKSAVSSIPIAKSNRLPKFENVSKAVLKNYRMNSNLILLIKEDGKSILLLYDKKKDMTKVMSFFLGSAHVVRSTPRGSNILGASEMRRSGALRACGTFPLRFCSLWAALPDKI